MNGIMQVKKKRKNETKKEKDMSILDNEWPWWQ